MKITQATLPLLLLGVMSSISSGAMASPANSDQPYAYLGGGIGYGQLDGQNYTDRGGDLNSREMSWKGVAGYHLNRIISFEGQYIDFGTSNRGNDQVQASGWTVGAVFEMPVNGPVAPYAKISLLNWETNNRFSNISNDQTGTDLGLGLGVRYSLSNNLDLRGEYEHFHMDQTQVDSFSVVLQYKFL
ncbi:MAG: porin family protein [Pseudomonadales bacterium]|nr:porin family protein [Pseudomonadales bacterium]